MTDEGVSGVKCKSCNIEPATTRFVGFPVCGLCGFWLARKEWAFFDRVSIFHTEEWKSYSIGKPTEASKAFEYKGPEALVYLPGRPYAPIYTRNFFCAGTIPEHLRESWPGEPSILIKL